MAKSKSGVMHPIPTDVLDWMREVVESADDDDEMRPEKKRKQDRGTFFTAKYSGGRCVVCNDKMEEDDKLFAINGDVMHAGCRNDYG